MAENERKEEAADRRPLKLFIVGEPSGNPADWSVECYRAYVFARSAEEALMLVSMGDEPVAEIVPEEPMVLVVEKDDGIEV